MADEDTVVDQLHNLIDENATLRQLLEFAQRDAGHADELRAQLTAERARIAAVRKVAEREQGRSWVAGAVLAALAASPTPTGPEPAKAKRIGYLNADPLRSLSAEERQGFTGCPGPATPTEPTEETP